jgi:hypothetical protein
VNPNNFAFEINYHVAKNICDDDDYSWNYENPELQSRVLSLLAGGDWDFAYQSEVVDIRYSFLAGITYSDDDERFSSVNRSTPWGVAAKTGMALSIYQAYLSFDCNLVLSQYNFFPYYIFGIGLHL